MPMQKWEAHRNLQKAKKMALGNLIQKNHLNFKYIHKIQRSRTNIKIPSNLEMVLPKLPKIKRETPVKATKNKRMTIKYN